MKKKILKRIWNILLLVSSIFLVFIVPFFPITWHASLYNLGFTMMFFSSALSLEVHRKFNIYCAISVTILDIISTQFELVHLLTISDLASLLFFSYMVARFIIQISRSKIVDIKVIAESITAYLLLAMVFSILIAIAMRYDPNCISFPTSNLSAMENIPRISEYIYYSLVTMSTLGYGDVLPQALFAKSLMTFITVSGQFYMAIVVALLIGKFASSGQKEN
jgi:hypothetical protein